MSAITPFVKLEVVSAEEVTEAPVQSAQLLAPATYSGPDQASRPSVVVAVPDGEFKEEPRDASGREEDQGDGGNYRKRGRPRKYEGLDEEERRKRRMHDNRQSASRSYYRKVHRMKGLEEENAELRSSLKAGLAELASIDPKDQEQILEIARRTGQQLPDPALVKKFAREEDLTLPLFQHAKSIDQADTGDGKDPTKEAGEAASSATIELKGAAAAAAAPGGGVDLDPAAGGASSQ